MNSPCYECPSRKLACHSRCIKYINYRTLVDNINQIKLNTFLMPTRKSTVKLYKLDRNNRISGMQ